MDNKKLQAKYDQMHSQGPSAWFSDGQEERETILKMGEPWIDKTILEIGCGEGDLSAGIMLSGAKAVLGIDYSTVAIQKATLKHIAIWDTEPSKYTDLNYLVADYHDLKLRYDRIVMQGVLEHLNNPFQELKWMIDNLLTPGGDVITSSPCFLNPRGIVWMTLDMLGAVMSKTDLHYLNPWDFMNFCEHYGYRHQVSYCDYDWSHGKKMREDLEQRIPLACKDGDIHYNIEKINKMLSWLSNAKIMGAGATAIYRIQT